MLPPGYSKNRLAPSLISAPSLGRDVEIRLERGAAEGEALPCTEVRSLAEYIDSVVQGMAVRAMEGAPRPSLHRIVDVAMRVWDT